MRNNKIKINEIFTMNDINKYKNKYFFFEQDHKLILIVNKLNYS